MDIFITRHGQVAGADFIQNNPGLPKNDPPISDLGEEQARCLAKEMQRLGFKGKIYSSPFLRTITTARQVSHLLNIPIHTCADLREFVANEESMREFKGMSLDELRKNFSEIADDAELPYPWWKTNVEDFEAVRVRVRPLLERLIEKQEDVLLVGHGATAFATFSCLLDMAGQHLPAWPEWYNCSLTHFTYIDGKIELVRLASNSHMTNSMLTDNSRRASENVE